MVMVDSIAIVNRCGNIFLLIVPVCVVFLILRVVVIVSPVAGFRPLLGLGGRCVFGG